MSGHQRFDISTATNLRGIRCRSAWSVFCPFAIWRGIAQERRGPNRGPSDGKIKAAACGTVGRQNSIARSDTWRSVRESMTACRFAQLIEQSRLCAPRVFRPKLQQARSHDRLARRCRTAAGPSRARAVHDRCSRLAALTSLHRPRLLGHLCGYGFRRARSRAYDRREVIAQRGVHIGHSFGGSRVRHCGYGLLSQV
jgi:hypothetical protein